jgi:hypothetical protein
MHANLEYIGQMAVFYLPTTKVSMVSKKMHEFFLSRYNAYTSEASDIRGFWRKDHASPVFDDHNVKYVVSFDGRERIDSFIDFLSGICREIDEECIYLNMGMKSYLVYPEKLNESD